MNIEIKRHIDSARQVLVGVVPNPTSQIEQITTALIYKFMDDMDQSSIRAGGEPSFFTGDLERYAWTRLVDSRVGNQDKMNLYVEALAKFSESKQLPELFRNIFKSAFLPYRSPEVLGLFIKEIAYFDYSHPEDLGDAYEYLLSIMSSQGDAGQFRTPRHIIDFIVKAVNPTKDDKILDPACGTAGFLVSAYKHILEQHDGKDDPDRKEKNLTPDERKKLMGNLEGYDIDPAMVRIAQVNMYLHQFKNPKIYQYDSLSMDERWNDKFDVILANPPFMSPKGGIKPHSKFSVKSNRSEVLFVDYIMNHLRPKGRAGIIVPEGVIFQSGKAYKELRKNLINDGLYAVVSLPSGVFQPYSGVKTSILLFDNEIASKVSEMLFIKIENDGFDLGAQRSQISKNDLPEANKWIKEYKRLVVGEKCEDTFVAFYNAIHDESLDSSLGLIPNFNFVPKSKIAKDGDYNLSGDRYRITADYANLKWPVVELGAISEIISGQSPEGKYYNEIGEGMPFYQGKSEFTDKYIGKPKKWTSRAIKIAIQNDILMSVRAPVGPVNMATQNICIGRGLAAIRVKKADPQFVFAVLKSIEKSIKGNGGATFDSINQKDISKIKIPLPSIEVQNKIVEEIDKFQKIIDGANAVVDTWTPSFRIDNSWNKAKLGDLCNLEYGYTDTSKAIGDVRYIRITDISSKGLLLEDDKKYINLTNEAKKYLLQNGDILVARTGATFGKTLLFRSDEPSIFASFLIRLRFPKGIILPEFYWIFTQSSFYWDQANKLMTGGGQPQFNGNAIKQIEVPLPPINIQSEIVENIREEYELISVNKKIVDIFKSKLSREIDEIFNSETHG